jgi:hypothetical protein
MMLAWQAGPALSRTASPTVPTIGAVTDYLAAPICLNASNFESTGGGIYLGSSSTSGSHAE